MKKVTKKSLLSAIGSPVLLKKGNVASPHKLGDVGELGIKLENGTEIGVYSHKYDDGSYYMRVDVNNTPVFEEQTPNGVREGYLFNRWPSVSTQAIQKISQSNS